MQLVVAPNPGPMTGAGTNTWLVGAQEDLAVIDPGPDDAAHLDAVLAAAGGRRVAMIVVTHPHLDHSAGARRLARATGAEVLAFGPAHAGRSEAMARLAARGDLSGGEGVDTGFAPDRALADAAAVSGPGWRLTALHTPGHLSSHLSLVLEGAGAVFTGDTVMGWASTLISPPDGSVAQFQASMDRLAARPERLFLPGHGAPVRDGPRRAAALKAHRADRAARIEAALAAGPRTLPALLAEVYADTPAHLHGAAARNLLAHLVDLAEAGRLDLPPPPLSAGAFRLRG